MQKSENRENELKAAELRQADRHHSYELTIRLSSFLISAEIVFCGYLLLNAEKIGIITFSSTLFLLSGLAAIFGLLWRFCYNQTYYENTHGKQSRFHHEINQLQIVSYWIYVILTILFFSGIVCVGFKWMYDIEHKNYVFPNKNQIIVQKLSDDIEKLQSGLESIGQSVKELSEIKPQIIVKIDSSTKEATTQPVENINAEGYQIKQIPHKLMGGVLAD